MSPLVSVIIPAFNAAASIRRTLESVRSQTYCDLEVIVVDDGSADDTALIVREVMAEDDRIILLQQTNQGAAAARNLAIQNSRGEFVAPIDADDIWYPTKIDRQVRCILEAGPAVGLVYTWSLLIDSQDKVIDGCPIWDVEGSVLEPLLYRNFIGNASAALIRRTTFNEAGLYNVEMRAADAQGCEDWEMYLRLAEISEFRAVPDYLVGYRQLPESMSANCSSMAASYERMMRAAQSRHAALPSRVFRWSRGHFFLYLLEKSFRGGQPAGALRWFGRALRADLAVLLSPRVIRTACLAIWQLVFPSRHPGSTVEGSRVSPAEIRNRKMQKRLPWRPFTLVQIWRWTRLTRRTQSSFAT